MQKVEDIADLVNGRSYVDCYISTDVSELVGEYKKEGILTQLGFLPYGWLDDQKGSSLSAALNGCEEDFESFKHSKTGLRIDAAEVIFDDKYMKARFGFVPMSKFRVYVNGSANIANEFVAILKALERERQNYAFVNENETKAFVRLSEYFETQKFDSLEAWLESRALSQ